MLGNYLLGPGQDPPADCAEAGEDSTCNQVSDIVAAKAVDPEDGTPVGAGEELTYTLSFTNTGNGGGEVEYVDRLAGVLDDAELAAAPEVSDEALTVQRDGEKLRISGMVAGGETVTVAYTVAVGDYNEQGDHRLVNFLARPGSSGSGKCVDDDPLCTQNPVAAAPADDSTADVEADSADEGDNTSWLPDTGGPTWTLLGAALVLLLAGALTATSSRRRGRAVMTTND